MFDDSDDELDRPFGTDHDMDTGPLTDLAEHKEPTMGANWERRDELNPFPADTREDWDDKNPYATDLRDNWDDKNPAASTDFSTIGDGW